MIISAAHDAPAAMPNPAQIVPQTRGLTRSDTQVLLHQGTGEHRFLGLKTKKQRNLSFESTQKILLYFWVFSNFINFDWL